MIFDIAEVLPQLIHSMRLVLKPDFGANYAKSMDLDTNKNIVLIRLKNSDILLI